MVGVHRRNQAARRLDFLPVHRLPHGIDIGGAGLANRLRRAPDGRVVLMAPVGGKTKPVDAASGEELSDVAPDSFERIIVNNRLRGAIEASLGELTLSQGAQQIEFARL